MADNAEDKAEKLAAAKKRFDELKKKQAKGKRKVEKVEKAEEKCKKDKAASSESKQAEQVETESKAFASAHDASASIPADNGAASPPSQASLPDLTPEPANESYEPTSPPAPSAAAASHSRAASFSANKNATIGNLRRPSISAADILRPPNIRSPNPLSPTEVVPDIYRKQATTISELTETVEKLDKEIKVLKQKEHKLGDMLLEKEELLEQISTLRSSLGEHKLKFEDEQKIRAANESEIEKLKLELERSTRQTSHLTSQLSQKNKTISDLRSQNDLSLSELDQEAVKEKEDQIESMEMEISKLRLDFQRSSNSVSEVQSALATAEEKLKVSEEAQAALQAHIDELKQKLDKETQRSAAESATRTSAEAKAKSLEAAIDVQNAAIKKLESTIVSWERDHKTVKQLYTEADNTAQESQKKTGALETENEELSRQLSELREKCNRLANDNIKLKALVENHQFESRRGTGSMQADDDELDGLEADERKKMRERIEELEKLLQDERRKAQHGAEKSRFGTSGGHRRGASAQGGFSEVEFLGNYPSLAEEDFLPSDDEEIYQQSRAGYNQQRSEQELRLEREKRIAEIKAGLDNWKGYKLDLTQIGGNFLGLGETFEI